MPLHDSDWRDPNWTTLKSLRGGITDAVREDRKTMFDQNTIEIEARSIGQLLIDEVLHPFYIFQIASIILWSLDDYYFYAVTIALISVLSISTTLIETRNVSLTVGGELPQVDRPNSLSHLPRMWSACGKCPASSAQSESGGSRSGS